MGAFASIPVDLADRLENPGESLPVSGTIEPGTYTVGERELSVPDGVAYDVVLTNAGDGILVTGMVRAQATAACDRCLEQATIEIAGEIEEYYLFEEPEDAEAYEDGYELVGPDRVIDISAAIFDAVVMDTPFVVLCREDCQGLCPVCGANLNEGQCGCAEAAREREASNPANPFAALANLTFDE